MKKKFIMLIKKTVVKLLCITTVFVIFSGCINTNVPPSATDKSTVSHNNDSIPEIIDNDTKPTTTPLVTQASEQPVTVEPKLYERLSIWDDFYSKYGMYYSAIQIEDMFFYPGMIGEELFSTVANSDDTSIENIASTMLIEADGDNILSSYNVTKLTYMRGDTPWFYVYIRNYTSDLATLEDCIVSLVLPSKEAIPYCRFFDGTYTEATIMGISYSDMAQLTETLENCSYQVERDGFNIRVTSPNTYSVASLSEDVLYYTSQAMTMSLTINANTSLVDSMDVATGSDSACIMYTHTIPEDYEWSEENRERLLTFLLDNESSSSLINSDNAELISIFTRIDESNLFCIVKSIPKGENMPIYEIRELEGLGLNYIDEFAPLDHNSFRYYCGESPEVSYIEILGRLGERLYVNDDYVGKELYEKPGMDELVREFASFDNMTEEDISTFINAALTFKPNYSHLSEPEAVCAVFDCRGDNENTLLIVLKTVFGRETYYYIVSFGNPFFNIEKGQYQFFGSNKTDTRGSIEYALELYTYYNPTDNSSNYIDMPNKIIENINNKYGYVLSPLSELN